MICHEVDYEIKGDDMQLVEVELDPNEAVIAEAGAMNYLDDGIHFEAKMGDGSNPQEGFFSKLWSAGSRAITGESVFLTHFTNQSSAKRRVAFASPYPGKIIPLALKQHNNQIICQRDSFLAAALGSKVSVSFNKKLGAGFFGGEGFILQKIEGDGMAFIHACGTLVRKELNNETLRVDPGCLVAMDANIDYDIQRAGNLKSMIFGGEGLFLATLKGTGSVWVQSLPFSRLADKVLDHAPKTGGTKRGEHHALDFILGFFRN